MLYRESGITGKRRLDSTPRRRDGRAMIRRARMPLPNGLTARITEAARRIEARLIETRRDIPEVRALPEVRDVAEVASRRLCDGIATGLRCGVAVTCRRPAPSLRNDDRVLEPAIRGVEHHFGLTAQEQPPSMGAEDFPAFADRAPGFHAAGRHRRAGPRQAPAQRLPPTRRSLHRPGRADVFVLRGGHVAATHASARPMQAQADAAHR